MKRALELLTFLLLAPLPALQAADTGSPARQAQVFDIRAHGAVGDGRTMNTTAIQTAIDACHAAGGGRVVVPEGVFVSGSLQLKSRVILKVEKGAILRGSPDIKDYAVATAPLHWGAFWQFAASQWRQCLIYAENAEHVGIEGPGTIDGQGGRVRNVFPNAGDSRRPMLVRFERCRHVTVRDVTLIDPAAFTTFFVRSEDILIEGVTIRSRNSPNGDGLDFDGCRRVRIARCDLDTGDDGIGPKTFHPDWPNEDFTISDCRISTKWHAIRIGAESIGPFRRFEVRDCVFEDVRGGVKIEASEGAVFEDLTFRNIEMREVAQPVIITATRFAFSAHSSSVRPPVGRIRGVRFENVRAVVRKADPAHPVGRPGGQANPFEFAAAAVVSLPGYAIEDVRLSNIDFSFPGDGTAEQAARWDVGELLHCSDYMRWAVPFDGPLPASVLYLRHLRGVHLENVRFAVRQADARPFIAGDDIDGLTLQGVVASAPAAVSALAKLADVQRLQFQDCRVEGGESAPIVVAPSAEEMRRLADLRLRATALDRAIQQAADAADAAAKGERLLALPAVWSFRPDPRQEGEAARWFAAPVDAGWTKLRVDQPWSRQGHADLRGAGWYAVTFDAPAMPPEHRIWLRFGAVSGTCRVWLDGRLTGKRTFDPAYAAKLPFVLDVTGLLRPLSSHRLVVQVVGDFVGAGLTQPVELLSTAPPARRPVATPLPLSKRATWLREAKWGVFYHYLAAPASATGPAEISAEEWNRRIDAFDVEGLARQLEALGAGYFFLTLGQSTGYYLSPNATYDRIVGREPSRCSRRDLVADIAAALKPRGIRTLVYLPPGPPRLDRQAMERMRWTPVGDSAVLEARGYKPGTYTPQPGVDERLTDGQRNWEAVVREWSLRWGRDVHGWWIDGPYPGKDDFMYRHKDPPNFWSFAEAMRAGNPDSIVTFNPGVGKLTRHSPVEDYTAGEFNDLPISVDAGNWARRVDGTIGGAQVHILTFLGDFWGRGRPRFGADLLYAYTKYIVDHGAVISWDVPPAENGLIPEEYFRLLLSLQSINAPEATPVRANPLSP